MDKKQAGKVYNLLLKPGGMIYQAPFDETLLAVMPPSAGLASDCGGRGQCGKCLVLVEPGGNLSPPDAAEGKLVTEEKLAAGYRLACRARIRGDVTVTLPDSGGEDGFWSPKGTLRGDFSSDPLVARLYLPAGIDLSGEGQDPRDLQGLVVSEVKRLYQEEILFVEGEGLSDLSRCPAGSGPITVVRHLNKGVTSVFGGRHARSLGLAFDIGTTTVAAYLCDLTQGSILFSLAEANPQRPFGEDVISRITFACEKADGIDRLQKLIVECVNGLTAACLAAAGGRMEDVDEVVVVGNTTMEHIFCGLHPRSLGVAPYLPVTTLPLDLRAGDLGLHLKRATNVHVFPVISGFVGGDTVAAVLASGQAEEEAETLLIDIGTNGELVLGNRHSLWATSCATGPALEGAHISCGMRAIKGAIEQVAIDPDNYGVSYRTIGAAQGGPQGRPKGICGSGIIDAVAEMLRAGIIQNTGRIRAHLPGVITDHDGIGRSFIIAKAEEKGAEREISLTLADIRQVQLAKGALMAGIKLLLKTTRIPRLERIILTGAFGARFNWRNAVTIGMLPPPEAGCEVKVMDNLAGLGAVMALLDREKRKRAQHLAKTVQFLELANEADFVSEFTRSLNFPPFERR